jgi:dethiobiotin synthetase
MPERARASGRAILVVSGTGTEVGKTWVAARLLAALRRDGVRAVARKPVQSFEPGSGPTDAEVLAAATGQKPHAVCRPERWLPCAMAPPMAADALGLPSFTVADLRTGLAMPTRGLVVVEGVGGPRSPLAADGDTVDLAEMLKADAILLVADAGLGAINAVRLAVAPFAPRRVVVFLNRFDPDHEVHRRNLAFLRDHDGIDVVSAIGELVAWLAIGDHPLIDYRAPRTTSKRKRGSP